MTARIRAGLISLLIVTLVHAPLYADDCSGFDDCYNTLRGALAALVAMAAFAIVLFALVEAFPIIGWALMVHGAIGGVTGKDPITGRQLEAWERVLGLLPTAGLAFKEAGLLRSLSAVLGELVVDTRGAVLMSEVRAESMAAGEGAAMGEALSTGKGPLAGATESEIDQALNQMTSAGNPQKLQPHAAAPQNRGALGVSGKDVQSAHGAPQAVMKGVKGYNPNHALTKLLEKGAHSGMDQHWKDTFQAMRRAGRTEASAQEVYDIVAESIQRAPELPPGDRSSLVLRLHDEMFVEYGLNPADRIPLPYPNITP